MFRKSYVAVQVLPVAGSRCRPGPSLWCRRCAHNRSWAQKLFRSAQQTRSARRRLWREARVLAAGIIAVDEGVTVLRVGTRRLRYSAHWRMGHVIPLACAAVGGDHLRCPHGTIGRGLVFPTRQLARSSVPSPLTPRPLPRPDREYLMPSSRSGLAEQEAPRRHSCAPPAGGNQRS